MTGKAAGIKKGEAMTLKSHFKSIIWVFIGFIFPGILLSCMDNYDYGKDYTITFNADGGTGTIPSPMKVHADLVVAYFTLPDADLHKGEFEFIGWREPGYSFIYSCPGEELLVSENMELKAVYENDNNIPSTPPGGGISGLYVTKTGAKYHKYGHMGATIPLAQGKNGPYTACKTCF
jgi:hypothetical protein